MSPVFLLREVLNNLRPTEDEQKTKEPTEELKRLFLRPQTSHRHFPHSPSYSGSQSLSEHETSATNPSSTIAGYDTDATNEGDDRPASLCVGP